MRIQHNIMAMNAYRNYNNNTSALSKNLEKLSSGYKINRAGDDAAGLAISEKMRAQITGLEAAQKNVKDGTSLVKTAEGAMQEIHDMLNRMDYLATQSANGTYDNEVDRLNLQKEISSLKSEINRIADSANFNGIKLLDGVSGSGRLSTLPVEYDTLSSAAGVTLDSQAGTGTKGVYELNVDQLFGTGDTLKFEGLAKDGTTALASAAGLTLTYDATATAASTFTGATTEEQAKSIAEALSLNADYAANFDITSEGSKVILTAKAEGTEAASVTNVTATDKTVTLGAVDLAKQPNAPVTAGAKSGWDGLFSVGGLQPEAGDKLEFSFTGANGEALTATIEVTEAMVADRDTAKLTTAVANALNQATFNDNPNTGVDESKLKVSDLFTITPNVEMGTTTAANGGLSFEGKSTSIAANLSNAQVTGAKLVKPDGKEVNATAVKTPTAATGTPKGQTVEVAAGTNNFSAGDVFRMTGKLSTGEDFTVELVAGKDFAIGASYNDSMTNIANALKNGKDSNNKDLKITVGDRQVESNKIFGAAAATHEFNIAAAAGVLTITSLKAGIADGKGISNKVNVVEVKTAPEAKATFKAEAPLAQGSASATITLDDKIKGNYGTAITVGDKTYEIVADARDVSSRNNEAVVVKDLANATTAEIAKALGDTIKAGDPNEQSYKVDIDGNTVTVSTVAKGSDVAAIKVDTPYGDKVKTASFTFDPKNVKEGSVLTFNGNTYEFVKKGGEVKDGNIAIEMADPSKATAKELGDAFAAVVKNGTASVDANGKVTLKGVETEDGKIADPVVTWENNLVLQIGDTADDFNQLSVKLSDMHTTAMGIDGVDIGTQEGAQAAIDVIKDAINYVSGVRGDFGAIQNRLDHTANNLSVMAENIQDAESAIRDTDVAAEMMSYVKNNILVQSAQAMLAQANQVPQGVLQLLG
jgi:flagellin-like hook-associated protein FlgL